MCVRNGMSNTLFDSIVPMLCPSNVTCMRYAANAVENMRIGMKEKKEKKQHSRIARNMDWSSANEREKEEAEERKILTAEPASCNFGKRYEITTLLIVWRCINAWNAFDACIHSYPLHRQYVMNEIMMNKNKRNATILKTFDRLFRSITDTFLSLAYLMKCTIRKIVMLFQQPFVVFLIDVLIDVGNQAKLDHWKCWHNHRHVYHIFCSTQKNFVTISDSSWKCPHRSVHSLHFYHEYSLVIHKCHTDSDQSFTKNMKFSTVMLINTANSQFNCSIHCLNNKTRFQTLTKRIKKLICSHCAINNGILHSLFGCVSRILYKKKILVKMSNWSVLSSVTFQPNIVSASCALFNTTRESDDKIQFEHAESNTSFSY